MASGADAARPFGDGPLILLKSGAYKACLAPAAGGRVMSLDWLNRGQWRPLLVPWDGQPFKPDAWPKAGAFPMLPFANRLHPQGFGFDGRQVRPQPSAQGFALHGFAHRQAWQVLAVQADSALIEWTHEAQADWPWSFTARQELQLGVGGLAVRLSVRNDAAQAMPLAMGWHPYHPHRAGATVDSLVFKAQARHELDGHGRAQDTGGRPDFAMSSGETAAFSRWDGRAVSTGADCAIVISCQSADHLVLHKPTTADYLCIEPVTTLPGHLGDGLLQDTTARLQAGQTRTLHWRAEGLRCAPHGLAVV